MMVQGVSISEMLNQSTTVLTKPSVATFEQYEKRGGMREALIYVGVASALAGIVGLIFGLLAGNPVGGFLGGILRPLAGYFVFSFILFYIGKQQGGTGTQDEVFYTTALYTAPLQALGSIVGIVLTALLVIAPPIGLALACLAVPIALVLAVYQGYLGYLAARASMNLDQNKAIISVVVAIVLTIVAGFILSAIFRF
jgi:Yip1 domain